MPPTRALIGVVGGVVGGWLAIMAPAVVTLALRVDEFGSPAQQSAYAAILAVGWLSMMVSLVLCGMWGDAEHRRRGSRARLARMGVPLIAVGGVLLAVAPTALWLGLVWVVVQVPSAMVITTALADSGEVLPVSRRGLASGLVGAAPIIGLLLGGIVVQVFSTNMTWAFVTAGLIGAVLASPLMFVRPEATSGDVELGLRQEASKAFGAVWIGFLVTSFLLAWSTSTTNGFLVTLVQQIPDVHDHAVADTTSTLVVVASGLAVIASIAGGMWSHGRFRSWWLWTAAALGCAVALTTLLISPTTFGLFLCAAIFGISFGMANGVELAVILALRARSARLGRDLGVFTAATTAPYVLVPALAVVILSGSTDAGVTTLFLIACVLAFIAAAIMITLGSRARRTIEEPLRTS